MNLWTIFPESLLSIEGILSLPILAVPFYLYVLFLLIKQPEYRIWLTVFLILSLMASLTMLFSLGPKIGLVFPPLMLISVMLMPIIMLIFHVTKKKNSGIWLWGITSVAGWLHSLSWVVWLFALARS